LIAVISTARYHPALDEEHDVEREHAWPASHCEMYLRECCDEVESVEKGKKKAPAKKAGQSKSEKGKYLSATQAGISPMQAAVSAHNALPSLEASPSAALLSGLWLGRVCRTASHELGHCFGIGHCVYYACSMQGSASIIEDARQPPYLCPVDLVKSCKLVVLISRRDTRLSGNFVSDMRMCIFLLHMELGSVGGLRS